MMDIELRIGANGQIGFWGGRYGPGTMAFVEMCIGAPMITATRMRYLRNCMRLPEQIRV
jgi:hypothetical protein